MDGYEATRIVFQRIQNMDPENASKIMGLLLLQDHGEKEMIRLAFGPESLLHSVIFKARNELGLSLNSPSTPQSPSPFHSSNPVPISRQNSSNSSRLIPSTLSIPNPSSNSASWADDSPSMNSSSPFYGNGGVSDSIDEFQLQEQLSFLNDGNSSPSLVSKNSDLFYSQSELSSSPSSGSNGVDPSFFPSYGYGGSLHRRSCSVNDAACLVSEDPNSGLGWKPCLYYARGYCKNGTSCRFLHGGFGDGSEGVPSMVGSPNKIEMMDQCHEQLLRSKSLQQQRLAAASQLMATSSFPYSPKSMNVRIPYQQKRMFGFVTFVYPETVKLILAKGNPHFVCDARVLVKPYKEKGKVPDKKQQQMDRGDFSPCGGRMYYNTQDILWRRKLEEQAELQQALELQSRRLMSLQLLDIKKQHQRALSTGSPIPSPTHSPNMFNHNFPLSSFHSSSESQEDNGSGSGSGSASTASIPIDQQVNISVGKEVAVNGGENGNSDASGKQSSNHEDSDLQESLEHNLPDSPFASPTKAIGDYMAAFNNGSNEAIDSDASTNSKFSTNTLLPPASPLDMGSFKSYNCQLPR
ncbi:hypothetical protein TSUD_119400 [Trifolium subterraneum]|uniref:C3H1-type domain-containing protein n=2 Tax=Trifolium TaxID=3898 RepID=A0A2Z6NNQ6_TRISU|nr:hypothetical protein TSUD_119400 [Trifolium subterraneum]